MPESIRTLGLLECAQVFQERLMNVDSLEGLVSLACSVLDCSLYVCDGQGYLLANSAPDPRACEPFRKTTEVIRRMPKKNLKNLLMPRPHCNTMRDACCVGDTCTRIYFPLKIAEKELMGAIVFFIWDRTLSADDQALASIIAGAFSAFMNKRFAASNTQRDRRKQLFRELLDYKPGLRPYYEQGLAAESLNKPGKYRMLVIALDAHKGSDVDALVMAIEYRMPDAWVFAHKGYLLCIFAQSWGEQEDRFAAAQEFLTDHALFACVSMEFSHFLDLRYVFENTQFCLAVAGKKDPGEVLHYAERYIDLAFLHKCRAYFPPEQFYPEGFRRLHDHDEQKGTDYLAALKAYLDNNMSVSAAAKEIFIHRNTLSQQLEKIEEILGVSLADKKMCWYLQLCLRIHELLEL